MAARHQVGVVPGAARLWDGVLWSTRHQIGGLVWLQGCEVARLWDGALWSTRHQIGGLVWLQGSGDGAL